MKKLVSLFGSGLLCLLLLGAARAQGVGSSGDIRGTVTDPSGAVVPNATVVVADAAKGLRRTVQTDDAGQYQVTGLPPSAYDVSAEAKGFQTELRKGGSVTIGQTVFADFELKVSAVNTQIVVTDTPPVADTTQGQQANVIEQKYL